jgi:hypothetical protein
MGRILEERKRQIALGYTKEHDKNAGVGHLLYWSGVYILRFKFTKGIALLVAALELLTERRN